MQLLSVLMTLLINPLELCPDSVEVTIVNSIPNASISSIYCLVAGSRQLSQCQSGTALLPGSSTIITLPFRFFSRVIFCADNGLNYREVFSALNPRGDSIVVSRSDREFGGYFDVILGSRPFRITNAVPVPLTGAFLHVGDSLSQNLIGTNPLLPGEVLFLWMDCDTIMISFRDVQGFLSSTSTFIRDEVDSVFSISVTAFLGDGFMRSDGLHVVNCVNNESIVGIDVVPVNGESVYFDLSENPMGFWEGVSIPFRDELSHIVCVDSSNREYTVDTIDEESGAYIIDWMSIDFDFSFPSGRR